MAVDRTCVCVTCQETRHMEGMLVCRSPALRRSSRCFFTDDERVRARCLVGEGSARLRGEYSSTFNVALGEGVDCEPALDVFDVIAVIVHCTQINNVVLDKKLCFR
jgi:hypothetical protein